MNRGLRTTGEILVEFVRHALVEPVLAGRLRSDGWPPGVRTAVGIGLSVYCAGLAVVGFAPQLRGLLPHDSAGAFPPVLLPVVLAVVTILTALLTAGCLHAPWPVRVLGLAPSFVLACYVAGWSTSDPTRGALTQVAWWLVLVGFAVWRWRRAYAWWEFVVVQAIVGGGIAIAAWTGLRGLIDHGFVDATTAAVFLVGAPAAFVLPVLMIAGMALSEVAFTSVTWAVETVSARVSPRLTAALTAGLVLLALATVVRPWIRGLTPPTVDLRTGLSSAALLVLTGAGWWLVDRLADSRGAASTRIAQLVPRARLVGIALALILTLPVVVSVVWTEVSVGLGNAISALGLSSLTEIAVFQVAGGAYADSLNAAGALAAAVVAIPAAVVAARHNHRGIAELLMAGGILSAASGADILGWLPWSWTLTGIATSVIALVVAVAGAWAVRGRLTPRRTEAVAVALLLGLTISHREVLSDPVDVLIGSGDGGGLLVLGLVWLLLTETDHANGHSERFPQASRAILVISVLALVMSVFAFNRLAVETSLDIESFVESGSDILGTGLLLCGLWAVLGAARRDEEVIESLPSAP